MRLPSRCRAFMRPAAAALTLVALLALTLMGCGGASNDSSGGRSTLWNTSNGGDLQVTISNPATRSTTRSAAATTLRVHVQSNGTDVTSYQQVAVPATGSSVTLDFGWVANSANSILVELLDSTGTVVSTQTSTIAWTSTSGSLLVQVSLGSGSASVASLRQYVYVATNGYSSDKSRFVDDPTLMGIDMFTVDATGAIVGSAVPQATQGKVLGLAVTPDQKYVVAIVGALSPSLQAFAIDPSTGTLTKVTQAASTSVSGANGGIAITPDSTLGAVGLNNSPAVVQAFTLSSSGQIALGSQFQTNGTPHQLSATHVLQNVIVSTTDINLIMAGAFDGSANPVGFAGGMGIAPVTNLTQACATLPSGVGLVGTSQPDANCFPCTVTHSYNAGDIWTPVVDGLHPCVVGNGTQVANSASIAVVPGLANPVGVLTTDLGTGGTSTLFANTLAGASTGTITPLPGTSSVNVAGASASTIVVPSEAAQAAPTNAACFIAVVGTGGLTPVLINATNGLTVGTTVPCSATATVTFGNTVGSASFYQ